MRFKGFEGEWEKKKLGEIAEIKTGDKDTQNKVDDGMYPFFVRSNNVERINSYSFDGEAILTSGDGVGVGKNFHYINGKFDFHQRVYSLRSFKKGYNGKYIYYVFSEKFYNRVIRLSAKNSVDSIRMDMVTDMGIFFPTIIEQQKIASFLTLIDDRIATQSKIVENLETLIKGLCQNLVGNNKKKNRKKQYLKDILVERKELNVGNYSIHSVSVSKGVINQIEYLGRSFAAKDTSNYNVVDYGDMIYTKSPTGEFPYGIIKQSFIKEKVAVSPLYGVFVPKNIYLANILHYYFKNPVNANNYLHSLIQKGAKNTINITNQSFLDKEIYLPTDEREIKAISNLLNSITQKIVLAESLRDKYTQQKKYLLQNLFI